MNAIAAEAVAPGQSLCQTWPMHDLDISNRPRMARRTAGPEGAARRLWAALFTLLFASWLATAVAAAQVPNVTGTWGANPGDKNWHLVASGQGLQNLHATWSGLAAGGHAALRGTFDGTLSGSTYTGSFSVTEGAVHVTGTMSFRIDSPTLINVSLRPAGGNLQSFVLHRQDTTTPTLVPVKINIQFYGRTQTTAAFPGGGFGVPSSQRCAGPTQLAESSGSIEAQITPDGSFQGSGYVTDRPRSPRCHDPNIKLVVDHITIDVITPEHVVQAVLAVHIDGESYHQTGQCTVGTPGTIEATYDDSAAAPNGLNENDLLKIGPWGGRGCNADNHTFTDNGTIAAYTRESTWVRAWIGCLGRPGGAPGGPGYSPRNCGI